MTERIEQTAAEIEVLLLRKIADLFDEVIFPNYGKVTSDGVTLGPAWWAKTLERNGIVITVKAIEGRIYRMRRSGPQSEPTGHGASTHEAKHVASARAAIRAHPALAAELIKDAAVRETIIDTVTAVDRAERKAQRISNTPAAEVVRKCAPLMIYGRVVESIHWYASQISEYLDDVKLGHELTAEQDRLLGRIRKAVEEFAQSVTSDNVTR